LVSTEAGFTPIGEIAVGDEVLAYNEATGETDYHSVVAVWAEDHNLLVDLVIDDETIRTTPEHPFYTADGEWMAAGLLYIGDWIRQADGGYSQVAGYALVAVSQSMHP